MEMEFFKAPKRASQNKPSHGPSTDSKEPSKIEQTSNIAQLYASMLARKER
jgi:hypothetical protein